MVISHVGYFDTDKGTLWRKSFSTDYKLQVAICSWKQKKRSLALYAIVIWLNANMLR